MKFVSIALLAFVSTSSAVALENRNMVLAEAKQLMVQQAEARLMKRHRQHLADDKAAAFKAPAGTVNKSPGADRYQQVSTEFDNDYNKESTSNGYKVIDASDIYNQFETKDIETQLDGKALTGEFGGKILQSELYDRKLGAGLKDRGDLEDMLNSIKGSSVFMNHTPKEQL